MVRPRRFRRIFQEHQIRCFRPDLNGDNCHADPVEVTMDEIEAIRLKDYQDLKQGKAAEIMDVSQPTFHRILNLARGKVAKAIIEGKMIKIKGGDFVADNERYKCKSCSFEWYSPEKEYEKCPDCGSEYIYKISTAEEAQTPAGQPGMGRRRGFGGGMGAGQPRVCKCPNCGYESPKIPGVPCRNTKCPECGTQLCGAD
jgi:predicted DNA-binding protein (UPF0251 family)/DNA-directed RNA polymerase subunit RPC12/RpoP